jgi:probable rRNA maturation factor
MLDVEVLGAQFVPDAPSQATVQILCVLAAASAGVEDGHLAIEYVNEQRIAQLNEEYRGKEGPTDVLSFPIDGAAPLDNVAPHDGLVPSARPSSIDGAASSDGAAPSGGAASIDGPTRELGDVVICPEHTSDLREAIVHGVLHLVGMDHETDSGEMLALQAELLKRPHPPAG